MAHNEFSDAFHRMTVDQMITLVSLYELKHTHMVARSRGRDQSSIIKQVDTANSTFLELCGERLVNFSRRRGQEVQFTPTGEAVVELLESFLENSRNTIDSSRRALGRKVTTASTTGMLEVIATIWPKWREKASRVFDLQLEQIRTYKVATYLRERKADLVFAGIVNHPDMEEHYKDFRFLEWECSKVVVLSNMKPPTDSIGVSDIIDSKLPLILPQDGVIRDFAKLVFKNDMQQLRVVAEIEDLYFGLGLLKHNIYQAYMLTIEKIADNFIKETTQARNVPFYKFAISDVQNITISSGLFCRREAEQYASTHPVNICWEVFREEAEKHKKLQQ